jgi:hypothetical protein
LHVLHVVTTQWDTDALHAMRHNLNASHLGFAVEDVPGTDQGLPSTNAEPHDLRHRNVCCCRQRHAHARVAEELVSNAWPHHKAVVRGVSEVKCQGGSSHHHHVLRIGRALHCHSAQPAAAARRVLTRPGLDKLLGARDGLQKELLPRIGSPCGALDSYEALA